MIGSHRFHTNHEYKFDLNRDGFADFTIDWKRHSSFFFESLWAVGQKSGNSIMGTRHSSYALLLKAGTRIGPKDFFKGSGLMVQLRGGGYKSNYSSGLGYLQNCYLGLKFLIKGKTHYGWARLNIKAQKTGITALLTGYAYETVPNKPIIAGKTHGEDVITVQPASLGYLARGASAIPAWRVKEGK